MRTSSLLRRIDVTCYLMLSCCVVLDCGWGDTAADHSLAFDPDVIGPAFLLGIDWLLTWLDYRGGDDAGCWVGDVVWDGVFSLQVFHGFGLLYSALLQVWYLIARVVVNIRHHTSLRRQTDGVTTFHGSFLQVCQYLLLLLTPLLILSLPSLSTFSQFSINAA